MLVANEWKDFELIDAGDGEKLEKWGKYFLRRPDPLAVWPIQNKHKKWDRPDAIYHRSKSGGGNWDFLSNMPEQWTVSYKELKFNLRAMGFKHTGLFPEQAVNWDWIIDKIKNSNRSINVLNLFAYTGGATVASAFAGANVCHVDASKGMVEHAKQNLKTSGLGDKPVRFIVDDVVKFVKREIRRGNKYDAIIMDPPAYGRGPDGEVWNIEKDLFPLVELCVEVMSEKPLFFIINNYTDGLPITSLNNVLKVSLQRKFGGKIFCDEIGLPMTNSDLILPCGIVGRWEA